MWVLGVTMGLVLWAFYLNLSSGDLTNTSSLSLFLYKIHVWGKTFLECVIGTLFQLCQHYLTLTIFHHVSLKNFHKWHQCVHFHYWPHGLYFHWLHISQKGSLYFLCSHGHNIYHSPSVLHLCTFNFAYCTQVCKYNCSVFHSWDTYLL